MWRQAVARISQKALQHNLKRVRQLTPKAKILAMVKANAYGHGLVETARALAKADALGVASLDEALVLREAGVRNEIVLMEGIFHPAELDWVQKWQLTLVVHQPFQVQALVDATFEKQIKVWLKINTGMNRLGLAPAEFASGYAQLSQKGVKIVGFMTHFSQVTGKDDKCMQAQCTAFKALIGAKKGQRSLANSAAILVAPQTHADWVRPGGILYGVSPFADTHGAQYGLIPAMSLHANVIAVRTLTRGDRVGYGGKWENKRGVCQIAIVGIGYGDGYPWQAKTGTPVWVAGQRAKVVGRVSMDMLAIEIGTLKVAVGDEVTLWGADLPVEEVARHAQTLAYELLCRVTSRVAKQSI